MGVEIKKISWDSVFFGYPIGKVILDDLKAQSLIKIKSDAKNFRLAYVFSKYKIEHLGFKHVDTKVVFKKEIFHTPFEFSKIYNISSFESDVHDVAQLKNLALQSGVHSRFYIDKGFTNNEYDKLYNEWLLKSLDKTLSFKTLVAMEGKNIIGFVTINKVDTDTAEIGLLAVDTAARGKGVGSQLIQKATDVILNLDYSKFLVATQEANTPAVRLYKKAGFKELSLQHIYHIWNDDTI